MSSEIVYLDHSATTPVDEAVFAAMKPYFSEYYGNPSSLHRQGQKTEAAIESARSLVAEILGCPPTSIFFTASATESNNLVLQGLSLDRILNSSRYHVLTTPVEHPSVLETMRQLQSRGRGMHSFLPVDRGGKVKVTEFENLLSDDIALVATIYGNNEIGTINPVKHLGSSLQSRPIAFHTDAVQTVNFIDLNVNRLQVDFLTLSAHKFYGPKGVGILYARDPGAIQPIMKGGSQESGLRPGTQNVPLIVGAAKALELAQSLHKSESARLRPLRDELIRVVLARISDSALTGDSEERLPHHASFVFSGIDSNELLTYLDLRGYACSSGSACKVGNPEPSALLLALGYPEDLATGALRVTLGKSSSAEIVEDFTSVLIEVVDSLRSQVNL